jgi:ABC-type branched-subunit amino acid transport system substrate-binding protein
MNNELARRRWTLLAPFGWMTARAAAAVDPGIQPREIVIGQNISLKGGANLYGVEVLAGVQASIDEVNRAGGVHGRKIVLRTLDDNDQAERAEANARSLLDSGAFILFGSIEGGPSTAVMRTAVERGVPFFGPMAGSPELRRPHQPLVSPVRAEHRDEFRALVRHGVSIGRKRVGLFHADSGTGRLHLESVMLAAGESGAEVVLASAFKPDIAEAQLDELVRQIARQQVDVMLNHGSATLYGRLIRKAASVGLRTRFFAVNSGSTQLAASLGPLAHGMVFSQVMPSPWSTRTAIVREYQSVFKRAKPDHELSYGSLEGYATAKAMAVALQLAGANPSRVGLVKALEGAVIDLGGLKLNYPSGRHDGSTFVDLAMVTREGKFLQ